MKKPNILIPVGLAVLALGFSACQKENSNLSTTDNSTLGFKLQAQNKSYSLPVNSSGTKSASTVTSISWDTATMIVSRIKFEAEMKNLITHHDSIEIEYSWNGPLAVNLLDTNISLGNFTLTPGFYDEIELKVVGLKKDAGNKPVFYLSGLYTNSDGISIPIVLSVNENIEFKTEKNSVEVTAENNSLFTSTILLYLDQLLADIQPSALDNATLTNGSIVISDESNNELYRIIIKNLLKDHHCKHNHGHGHGN
jgi:hypothetical protein